MEAANSITAFNNLTSILRAITEVISYATYVGDYRPLIEWVKIRRIHWDLSKALSDLLDGDTWARHDHVISDVIRLAQDTSIYMEQIRQLSGEEQSQALGKLVKLYVGDDHETA